LQNQEHNAAAGVPRANTPVSNTCVRVLHVEGRDWKVREEHDRFTDHGAESSLIFESPSLIRSVRTYPPEWFDLTDDALYQLSRGT
jgi:hypothetical protein